MSCTHGYSLNVLTLFSDSGLESDDDEDEDMEEFERRANRSSFTHKESAESRARAELQKERIAALNASHAAAVNSSHNDAEEQKDDAIRRHNFYEHVSRPPIHVMPSTESGKLTSSMKKDRGGSVDGGTPRKLTIIDPATERNTTGTDNKAKRVVPSDPSRRLNTESRDMYDV